MVRIGYKHSKETRRKISESLSGKNNPNYGKLMSEEQKQKIREAMIGDKNHNFGKRHSEETKQKCREMSYGKHPSMESKQKMSEAKSGENHPLYGKKHSQESKQKMSKANMGKDNPRWLGGTSFLPYCKKFNNTLKESVRNRDNRTCQHCEALENGRKHSIHHIHYDKSNCYPDLITLCIKCNTISNNNRDYWEVYYMNKLNDRNLLYWTLNELKT